jgi:hypothetical protein
VRKATAAALLLFFVLSLILTYPLALHLADAVEDRQDALLNVWITAWDGHQLLSDPFHLFDANIFHSYPRTLAYSELLLGNALLALPITAATGNPVLGYNLALLLSFVLSGFGIYLLVVRLTRSAAAGAVAGVIFAFSSYRMSNLAQAQILTTQWLPFALLSFDQLLRQPRLRHVITFVLFFCLQVLSSFYYAVLLAFAVCGLLLFELLIWIWDRAKRRRSDAKRQGSTIAQRSTPAYLLFAAACCALIILPFALPYFQVQREMGFERSLADNEPFSASLRQYLMVPPGSVVHGTWLPSDESPVVGGYPVDALFPGFVALTLALWGLIRGQGRTRWFYLLLLLSALLLSLGPRLYLAPGRPAGLEAKLPYAWLYAMVPGFKALRAPARFDLLAELSLAVLAGYGVAALGRVEAAAPAQKAGRMGLVGRLLAVGLPALLVGLVILESAVWPGAHAEPVPVGDQVPPVYHWLADQPPDPVLELPMAFTAGGPRLEYQYLSTYHWRTTPDGYSGFIPPKHGQVAFEMAWFPSERSVSLLQALGVSQVIAHTDRYPAAKWSDIEAALDQVDDLTHLETFGADQVYVVQPRSFSQDLLDVLGYVPAHAVTGEPFTLYVIAVNRGSRSYAVQPTDVVRASANWEPVEGLVTSRAESLTEDLVHGDIPLVISPDGGAAVISLRLAAPPDPGTYRLSIGERGGPLGAWSVDGMVQVGEEGETAFPVPARLLAWAMPERVRPGQPLPVDLTWRALGKIDAYYSLYVKLLDAGGSAVVGWDGQPRDGEAPTLLWVPGETIDDTVTLDIPTGMPPGDYIVEVGMYRAEDLARALTLNQDGVPVDRVMLGTVRIRP